MVETFSRSAGTTEIDTKKSCVNPITDNQSLELNTVSDMYQIHKFLLQFINSELRVHLLKSSPDTQTATSFCINSHIRYDGNWFRRETGASAGLSIFAAKTTVPCRTYRVSGYRS